MERLTISDVRVDEHTTRRTTIDANAVREHAMEIYWRLKEYEDAEADGRMVVLPCKDWLDIVFGEQSTFWRIDKDYIEEPIREISVDNAERIGWYDGYNSVFLKGTEENGEALEFTPDEIGKTVFLTRKEAEKALEAE